MLGCCRVSQSSLGAEAQGGTIVQTHPEPPPSLDQGHPRSACSLKGQEKIHVFNLVQLRKGTAMLCTAAGRYTVTCVIYKYITVYHRSGDFYVAKFSCFHFSCKNIFMV